jgi:hypothetical protein
MRCSAAAIARAEHTRFAARLAISASRSALAGRATA